MSYGQDARIGISFQNSYGTVNTASMHWIAPISESVDLKKAQIVQKGLRGIYDAGQSQEGLNTVDGDISIEAKANGLGVLLEATHASSLAITSGGLYTHVFRPRTADHQTLCAERPFTYLKYLGDTGSAHRFYDLNGTNLELSISNGELLTAKMGVVGGNFDRIAAVAATYSESNVLDWSVGSISLSGSGLQNVRALTVTEELNLTAKHVIESSGNRFPSRIKRNDARTVAVAGTLIFDDQSQANMFLNQSEQRLAVFLKGTSLVQSGYYETLLIDVPSLRFTEHPVPVGGPGEIEVSFKADGKYNVGSGTAIQYTLQCGKAGF